MAYLICDTECVGQTFLVCTHTIESGKERHFWTEDHKAFKSIYAHPQATFVVFNADYDIPLLQAFYEGRTGAEIKEISSAIIEGHLPLWQTLQMFRLSKPSCDWIDLMPITPGVKISLKTYAGRMHTRTMQDMPIDHTADITGDPAAKDLVLQYCRNDVRVTTELFHTVRHELTLREQMSEQYGLDLRSKSGAQIAQAVLCKEARIERKQSVYIPETVRYTAPSFLKRTPLIERIEAHTFTVNQNNGAVDFPQFLKEPINGIYQMGIGGLHSQHESRTHYIASPDLLITDCDVASFYPNLILTAGIAPDRRFIDAYRRIVNDRMEAKRAGDKDRAASLKLTANSAFGKLGERFCPFYAPDLMIAVTISGQLFLLEMIEKAERIPGVRCISANTDGITLQHPPGALDGLFDDSPFEWEQVSYREVAYADVNTYIAITTDGKVKRKGRFSTAGVVEGTSPTFQICADACAQYLLDRTPIEQTINNATDIRAFVAIRNVTGGGVQHLAMMAVDDWVLTADHGSVKNEWTSATLGKTVKRKSRPPAARKAVGGTPFGRVARWYISTNDNLPITYVKSGNAVPETDRAQLCMELPDHIPDDLDRQWYIDRAYKMLTSAGVKA